VMRGYNPLLQLHFVAIKGLWTYGPHCYERVEIICQSKTFKGSWISNGTSEVCELTRANIVQQFVGDHPHSPLNDVHLLGSFTRHEYLNLISLKVFIDAPKIIAAASKILSNKLLPPLAKVVMDYYSFESHSSH
jgi:hypothetical protein